ncbi:hisactophilin c49s mutant phototropin phy3 fusion protein [Colletotrichum karsti]|uniref:Hisactophilin c49s mutant phototropin phy3 fusion protein n=1 Tax=Colletotrichum karsti TaxID=1095194 RepID=A0A9P6HUA5_9PEZI|nr:hisactophilin c49s mutant phototropin phy3 fusion protein [Colletotrichum karsti]KAF9870843.1 hisactophilin c49s mutant phototropin phy3 fusion protein [Colletotrichum karsti]
MAQVAAIPTHRRHRHGELTSPKVNLPYSSLSVTSLGKQQRDMDLDEGGAEIPDIPFKRPLSRLPQDQSFTPSRFEEAWVEDESSWTHHGPISPNALNPRKDKSAVQSPEIPSRGRVKSPEPLPVRDRHTSSSPPRSPRTRSSRSRANSTTSSYQTNATSLPALQTKGAGDDEFLEPLAEEEVEPGSFDLVVPSHGDSGHYSLETRSELLFSKEHLQAIFDDHVLLQRFTDFLHSVRPDSLPLLTYYLDCLKALRAIAYANAIANGLERLQDHDFSAQDTENTVNSSLQKKADAAFDNLVQEDLPAYITYMWIQTVSMSIKRRITGTLPVQLREMSEGLAEVFCLTDPSRHDNPIVFASEEFHRTTQYGMNYVIGRNCRFLQGPKTNPFSVKRLRDKILAGKEHYETFLNYRRDGSPFMNLLMVAPLYDSRGTVRYFIGAQVDVSGLAKESSGLDALQNIVVEKEAAAANHIHQEDVVEEERDEFRDLSEMFNMAELETVRRRGGNMHRVPQDEAQAASSTNWHKPRILIQDETSSIQQPSTVPSFHSGKLSGIYEHYLLVRPYPSLRILFASPSLRMPGILQSNFMDKIGGSNRVRDGLTQAFADGHGVTAKVRWTSKASSEGRVRWIHCTPLLGSNSAVGVWMIVLVDDESDPGARKGKEAPPVDGRLRRISPLLQQHRPSKDDNMSLAGFAAMNKARDEVLDDAPADFDIDYDRPASRGSRSSRLSRGLAGPRRPMSPASHASSEPVRPAYTVRLEED